MSNPGLQTQLLAGAGGLLEPPRALQTLLRAAKPRVPAIRWSEAAGYGEEIRDNDFICSGHLSFLNCQIKTT